MKENTCCFIGHKTIKETEKLKAKLNETIEKLIVDKNVDTFLFGSRSRFNSLCQEIVTEIKEKYPHIKRIYVRAEYPVIGEQYEKHLLEFYEQTFFPPEIIKAGRAVYSERNSIMIEKSGICIFYFDDKNPPQKSGTKTAFHYAQKRDKEIINLFS